MVADASGSHVEKSGPEETANRMDDDSDNDSSATSEDTTIEGDETPPDEHTDANPDPESIATTDHVATN